MDKTDCLTLLNAFLCTIINHNWCLWSTHTLQ